MECDTLRLEIPSKCFPLQKGSSGSGSPSLPPRPPRSSSGTEKIYGSFRALSRLLYPVATAEGCSSAGCSGVPSTSLGNQNNSEQYRSTEHLTGLVNPLPPKRTRSVPLFAKFTAEPSTSLGNQNNSEQYRSTEHLTGLVNPLPPKRTRSVPSFVKFTAEPPPLATSTSSKEIKKQQMAVAPKVSRSTSLPLLRKMQLMRRQSSLRIQDVLVLHSATPKDRLARTSPGQQVCDSTNQDDVQEVREEEAVCRICMLELDEGGETLKMECSCKGELALAHNDCVVKWFSIRGNPLCDICGSEVQNLPVILYRWQSSVHWEEDFNLDEQSNEDNSSWHHLAAIVLSSALTSLWNKLEELSEFP